MGEYYISRSLRALVEKRSNFACEYCRIPQPLTYLSFHIDHIIAQQHGGVTDESNLAFACNSCNQRKGPNIAAYLPGTETLIRLFHPRRDIWSNHFRLTENGIIYPESAIGEATIRILNMNLPERLEERRTLINEGIDLTA